MKCMRLAALQLLTLPVLVVAQSTTTAQKSVPGPNPGRAEGQKPNPAAAKTAKKELDPEVAQRRSIALGSLTTLAIEARSYQDEALRARVQARIADALWEVEPENARNLFRRAWEAAEAFETQPSSAGAAVPGRVSANRPPPSGRIRTNLRSEVLKLAASRDHALGEEFLKRMAGSAKDAMADSTGGTALSEVEVRDRLRLAGEFLEADNVPRALQFADPALVKMTRPTISFLVNLRVKNAPAADQRFAALLGRVSAYQDSDANTVSLLTRYAFTPWIDLAVSPEGIPSANTNISRSVPNIDAPLRAAVLRVAANILLRPFAQLDQSSAGRAGTYFMAARLLPLFQQHAPELVPAINAQLTALGPEAAEAARRGGDRSLTRGMTPETAGTKVTDALEDRLERARNADERDQAYAFAAMDAARAGDPAAIDYLNKIEDLETRKGIRSFVDYSLIQGYLRKENVDDAIKLARKAEISHTFRSRVLIQAADLVDKSDRVRAVELLEEALAEARRIDASTPERAYALVSLLGHFAKLNRVRAWELVGETVKAGNAAPNFTGENGNTRWILEGKFGVVMGTELAAPTDLPESFAVLARDDFYQAMDVGRNFMADAPRALVAIAIARATLEEKNVTANSKP
ncbi:MAG TPA: hypothetical protein VEW46_23955 [Pyrinomonadaceae bacterium]|nr:hypothetical protein [Pyrinomonadaceae bacterium]